MTFEEFVNVVTRHLFVWRMAHSQIGARRNADRVAHNARNALDDAVLTRAEAIRRERDEAWLDG